MTLHPVSPMEHLAICKVFIDGEVRHGKSGSVTLHPISPMEHLAICKVFIDGEVRHGESGSVYPILLLEH